VTAAQAEALARALLAQPEVKPIGLGARNSLRLEAGLCLYGNDIDTTTTPVEGALNWAIQKVRRTGGARAGGFPGADKVLAQLDGTVPVARKRVGLVALERVPGARAHELQDKAGQVVGEVTSGLLGPTIDKPIAMGYVAAAHAAPGTRLDAIVRGKAVPMEVSAMPFVPQSLPPRLTPANRQEKPHDRQVHPDHEWIQLEGGTSRPSSASRCMRRTRWATWCSSTCRRWAAATPRARSPASWSRSRPPPTCSCPIAGEVTEVNEDLRADPSLANSDPLGHGWFFKVKIARTCRARR
jgi:hypothetical protein